MQVSIISPLSLKTHGLSEAIPLGPSTGALPLDPEGSSRGLG